jgi:ABC-2 type transport system ATP-binding protein
MTDQIALHTEGLTKHYGEVRALVDLDLDVRPGEVFGFLGPNGAGKTTTIRTVMDEIRPTAGRASILGMDCHRDAVEIRRHIGYLPSDLALYPNLTGKDTLTYFANLRGGVDWGYVGELAERLGAQLDKKVGDLSSGNRQKVGVIAAFMNRPRLLIMDEPSNGLDPLVQREFQTMMREVVGEGASVFLSSHTLSEVQRVADRVGIIRHGQLIARETVASLRSKGMRSVEIELGSPARAEDFESVPGARDVVVSDRTVQLSFEGTMDTLLAAIAGRYQLVDITTEEADLEEVFLTFYHDDEDNGSSGGAQGAAATSRGGDVRS